MIEKIEAIRKAIENKCYLPALSLALTIPDICGQIEYSGLVNEKGKRLVGKQYCAWFDEWVAHYYADHTGFKENGKYPKRPYFTGAMCYQLRCTYLHSGNSDIDDFGKDSDDEFRYVYHFELSINSCDSYGEWWMEPQFNTSKLLKHKSVRIDISKLCDCMCSAAERYYQTKNKDLFIEHQIKVIDIYQECEKIRKLNS